MEETWPTFAKDLSPDEISPKHSTPAVEEIREQYEHKLDEIVAWFWKQVDVITTVEEKKMLYDYLDDCVKEELVDRYNKANE